MKAATGFRAAQNLLMDPQVVGLTGFGSETIAAAAATIEAKHVPAIFVTPDRKPIVGKRFLFRHWVDGADMLDSMMPEIRKKNIKKISVVYSEVPAMTEFGDHLLRSAEVSA